MCDALPAALQNPQKKHALEFWSMYLTGFIDFSGFLHDSDIFLLFLGSPSRVRVCCAACGASEPSEKTRPGILEHVPYVFYGSLFFFIDVDVFVSVLGSPSGSKPSLRLPWQR